MLMLFIGLIIDVNFKLVCIVIICLVNINVFSIIMEIKLMVNLIINCWIFSIKVFIFINWVIGEGGIMGMIISVSMIDKRVFIGVGIDLLLKLIIVVNSLLMCIKGINMFVKNWFMVDSLKIILVNNLRDYFYYMKGKIY